MCRSFSSRHSWTRMVWRLVTIHFRVILPPDILHYSSCHFTNQLYPTRLPYTVPLMLNSRISCNACSTLESSSPFAYWSLVSASRYCCTCAIRLYASAQKRSCILTRASKLGSRYGTRRSMSCGSSVDSCSLSCS